MDQRLRIKNLILTALILHGLSSAQKHQFMDGDQKQTNIEQFQLLLSPMISGDDNKITLKSFIILPNYALQFLKENDGFQSRFESRISLLDKDGKQIDSYSFDQTLTAEDYMETIRKNNWYIIEHDFTVLSEKYKVVGEVLDSDTRKRGIEEKEIDLSNYNTDFFLMDPVVLTRVKGTWQGEINLIPTLSNEIQLQQHSIEIRLSGKIKPENFSIVINLFDQKNSLITSLDTLYKNSGHYFNEMVNLPLGELSGLRSKIKVTLSQAKNKSEKEIDLIIKRPGVSEQISNIDEALDQMKYILTNEEHVLLNKSKGKDRDELFAKFWKDRDPNPETTANELMDQYYLRVHYANDHFTSFSPGWQTDMGMIYILFGAPDDIERVFMSSNQNAKQTWHYYRINRSFIFYDENGFGDFRLTSPYMYGQIW